MKEKFILSKLTASSVACTMFVTTCFTSFLAAYAPVHAATTSNTESERENKNAKLSIKAATEGMVLLQNKNNTLPIASKGKIALFGGGACNTIKGGTGSGDVNQRYTVSVFDAFKNSGYDVTSSSWLENYKKKYDVGLADYKIKNKGNVLSLAFTMPDSELSDSDIAAASDADTGIYVISRSSGEGIDRTETKGDYYLTDEEYSNIKKMAKSFKNSIVLLNVGGVIDTKFIKEIPELDSVLLMSQAGMEGGTAVIKVLNGEVTPSGKLTDTWAENYSDYPSSKTFSSNDKDSLQENYTEGIYVGYRYFDSFNKKPAYEFGYGLSYTNFDMNVVSVEADEKKVTIKVNVKNTGNYSGKEVAQVYFSAPSGKLDKPYQELAGYGKTDLLAPGESQILTISYNTAEMSSYSEVDAAYIMEKGDYIVRMGNSSRNTRVAAILSLDSSVKTEQLSNQMKIDKNIDTLSDKGVTPYSYESQSTQIANAPKFQLSSQSLNLIDGNNNSKYDDEKVTTYIANDADKSTTGSAVKYAENIKSVDIKKDAKLSDVYNKNITMEQFVAGLSNEKLANIVEGIGFGGTSSSIVGAQSNSVQGAAGETTGNYYDSDGIPNIVLADGPAGIRITQSYKGKDEKTYYQYATAWPIGNLLAQTWNPELVEEFGEALGDEMTEFGVTLWLAPGMNIHKNPLCGRNFEYYSEDPFLTGTIGTSTTKGVQSHPGIGVTIKHFASNNQENSRSGENNTISERTLREIYLKGFEMAVKSSQPMAIMSSYNKINGKYTGADYDLLTDIARGEWNFGGLVMTDWFSSADPAESMHAGNDLIMPGGTQDEILTKVEKYAPNFNNDGYVNKKSKISYAPSGLSIISVDQWNSFKPSSDGKETVTTSVAVGVKLNDNISSMVTNNIATVTTPGGVLLDLSNSTYQRTVTYKGDYKPSEILVGDLQKSAIRVLNIIMQSTQFAKMNANVKAQSYEKQFTDLKNYLTLNKENITKESGSSSNHHKSNSNNSSSVNNASSTASNSSSNTSLTEGTPTWSKNADGSWSFVNSKGEKATGWVQDGGTWYHMDESGKMQTGWFKDTDGNWYYLNTDGSMKNGWLKDNDENWYYLDINGSMKTGWIKDTDEKWYYLNTNGEMAVNTVIDGYTIDDTGAWIS